MEPDEQISPEPVPTLEEMADQLVEPADAPGTFDESQDARMRRRYGSDGLHGYLTAWWHA
jgi:hypothetical protein